MYKIINLFLIIVMIFGTLWYLFFGGQERGILVYLVMFPLLIVPFVFYGTKYQFGSLELFWYDFFLFLAYFMGGVVNLYDKFSWYDLLIHFISGFFTFEVGNFILTRSQVGQYEFGFKMVFCLFTVMFIAGVWELLEYSIDGLFGFNLQHAVDTGVVDTMEDIMVAFFAGVLSVFGRFITSRDVVS